MNVLLSVLCTVFQHVTSRCSFLVFFNQIMLFTYRTPLTRVSKIDCHSRYLAPFNCKLQGEAGCHLTFIIWPLNPNVAAEGLSFFLMTMLAPTIGYKELHLTGHGHTMQPVEVKMFGCSIYVYMYRCAKQSSR